MSSRNPQPKLLWELWGNGSSWCHPCRLRSSSPSGSASSTGVVIAKKNDGTWGPPCACGLTGTGWGLGMGVTGLTRYIIVFILNRKPRPLCVYGSANKIGMSLGAHGPCLAPLWDRVEAQVFRSVAVVDVYQLLSLPREHPLELRLIHNSVNETILYEQKGIKSFDILGPRNGPGKEQAPCFVGRKGLTRGRYVCRSSRTSISQNLQCPRRVGFR
jgi:hypothetical protein